MGGWRFWRRRETRAAASDPTKSQPDLTRYPAARFGGGAPPPQYVSAIETAAATWASALAVADVLPQTGRTAGLTPEVLAWIGRSLVVRGEALLLIEVRRGRLLWQPVGHYDVTGGDDPDTWRYRLDLCGPTTTRIVRAGREAVAHFRWSLDAGGRLPWRGRGPMEGAALTAGAAAQVEALVQDAMSGPRGTSVFFQQDPSMPAETGAELDADLEGFFADNRPPRIFSLPSFTTASTLEVYPNLKGDTRGVREDLEKSILATCGVPIEFIAQSDGGGMREAYRRWGVTVQGRLDMVAGELSRVADLDIEISARRLRATDIRTNAMAYRALTTSQPPMDPERAARIVGFD